MKKYLLKLLLLFSPFILVIIIALIYFGKYLTAPKISSSHSFNEKIFWFNNVKADYISIGASTTLNNINSEEIVKNIHSDSYLNLSSWGLKAHNIYDLMQSYCKFHKPKAFIMAGNISDYNGEPGPVFNLKEIDNFWNAPHFKIPYYYFKHFDFMYYYDYSKFNLIIKKTNTDYSSLLFDAYGGVPLADTGFKINLKRIELSNKTPFIIDKKNYAYLDSICHFLKANNITLFYIYSPLRKSRMLLTDTASYSKCRKRTEDIIKKYGFYYYDSNYSYWADSLFADNAHMFKRGSVILTDSSLKKIILPNLPSIGN